ncbi:copper-binding protein [Phenylobacterium sp. J426]|uniref:copper-binding protein n=1 Tax=Phenylobacterium sp. J426 TaxID=2898439 RepID=UPI002151B537|nr:copper-binding protein [Phenylobacterium sp. J426]MCR5872773.1 copper-binding protein [Phenylobacterium sp. J426]
MKFAIALVGGLALAATQAPAMAQSHDHGAHSGHAAPAAANAQGQGVVKAIDVRAGSVTIAHEPIKALNWGAMTMAFKADPAALKGLSAGDKVSFTLKGQQIVAIRKQ